MNEANEYWGWSDPKATPEQRIDDAKYVWSVRRKDPPTLILVHPGQEPTTDVGVPVRADRRVPFGAAYCTGGDS